MKSSIIARCVIANELIRRRNQIECERTLHPRSSRTRAALITWSFEEIPNAQPSMKQQDAKRNLPRCSANSKKASRETGVDTSRNSAPKFEGDDEPQARHRKARVWKSKIACPQSNASFAIVRQKGKTVSQDTSLVYTAPSLPIDIEYSEFDLSDDGDLPTPRNMATQLESHAAYTTFRFPVLDRDIGSHDFHEDVSHSNKLSSLLEDMNDSTSPTSDTTLIDEPVIQSHRQLKGSDSLQDHISYDGMERYVRMHEESNRPANERRGRHRRNMSTDSAWSTSRTQSIPLRERAKTNDGMLRFEAGRSKMPRPPIASTMHRRKMSLNLPIKLSKAQPDVAPQPTVDSSDTESVYHTPYSHAIPQSDLTQAERELEYKHRHTFVGTASLDDFLELLELSAAHNTTKEAVAKAFIHLSSYEQLRARECSTRAYGWELVSRTTVDVSSTDYVAQWQVRLGSITLRHFLDLVPFDEKEECSALHVVEAFLAASHIDGRVGVGTGSKARAFRSWMVQQERIMD